MNARQTAEEIVTTWFRYESRELFFEGALHPRSRERLVAAIEAALVRAQPNRPKREADPLDALSDDDLKGPPGETPGQSLDRLSAVRKRAVGRDIRGR
jgi:hypothetical protein